MLSIFGRMFWNLSNNPVDTRRRFNVDTYRLWNDVMCLRGNQWLSFSARYGNFFIEQTNIYFKSTKETLKRDVKNVQS